MCISCHLELEIPSLSVDLCQSITDYPGTLCFKAKRNKKSFPNCYVLS